MGLIPTLISFSAGTLIKSADANSNNTNLRDTFNNTAVLTDVARTIAVAHTFAADILFTDALYDIGKTGATRPRDLFLSRDLVVGGTARITGNVGLGGVAPAAGTVLYVLKSASNATICEFQNTNATDGYGGYIKTAANDATRYALRLEGGGGVIATFLSNGIVLVGTTVTTSAAAGDVVLANAKSLRGVNAAGTDTKRLINLNAANQVVISNDGNDILWGRALVSLGAGGVATLGLTGGTGPATTTQNGWMQVIDSSSNTFWVPMWK